MDDDSGTMRSRGRLRLFLGAAPGVGKTYSMLEEGHQLREKGQDVVVGVVDTHGRAATAGLVRGLETIPRRTSFHRGVLLTEMDLEALLRRRPDIALVDELAHTNAPGSRHEKRWQDVEEILDAGIDVISTVNVQHIESLNDVVEQITGVPQRETVPDEVLRSADQIEVVDLAPQALRDRLAEGKVYPAERIDAALSNYFRPGNLSALRELALLWVADDVDSAMKKYRDEHGIGAKWETRERVVVALSGGEEGEKLLRRGARIAARSSGGDLLAVHVISQDGLRRGSPDSLAKQRALTEKLGGTYHQVVGDDIPGALVGYARAANATQLVLGTSHRSRLATAVLGPGTGSSAIRLAGDIDVHIVTYKAAGRRRQGPTLPKGKSGFALRRRLSALVLAAVGVPVLTVLVSLTPGGDAPMWGILAYQLLVVGTAMTGGFWPALAAAGASAVCLDFFFLAPRFTLQLFPYTFIVFVAFLLIGVAVSLVVGVAARAKLAATRAAAESDLLTAISGSVLRGQNNLKALLERTREAFQLSGLLLVASPPEDDAQVRNPVTRSIPVGTTLGRCGTTSPADLTMTVEVGQRAHLQVYGKDLDPGEMRLLSMIAAQIEAALEHQDFTETVDAAGRIAEADSVRTALLSAVSHDLRRPLAAARAAVTSLRTLGIDWSETDRDELLATADESLRTLTDVVTNLLDASRLQAGAIGVTLRPVYVEAVISPALEELHLGPDRVRLEIPEKLPRIFADPGLLRRVLVNLIVNATRYNPEGRRIWITVSTLGEAVEIRVIDHGPGVAPERRERIFVPFQRLDDTDNQAGLGLGLALAKGFTEGMGGTLTAEDTPGGGLTMVVSLHRFREMAVRP